VKKNVAGDKRYFVRGDGGTQSGPFFWYQLRAKLRTKQLANESRIRKEETDEWFPLGDLAAEREPEEQERSKQEVDDVVADARRRGKKHLVYGIACLGVGIVLTIVSFGFVLFWGLIVVGLVEIGRGINLMRS